MRWRWAAVVIIALPGCGGESERARTGTADAGPACGPGREVSTGAGYALQLASFADSARAAQYLDQLGAENWITHAETATVRGRRVWRVSVLPGQTESAARLAAHALRVDGAAAMRTTTVRGNEVPRVTIVPVNRGTHGMAAVVRWAFSPDGCAMIVEEDPAAVEAEPVPDGFLYVDDSTGTIYQRDSVWDVAPSPDWTRLAFSRAWGQSAGERDSLMPSEWEALAKRVGMPADTVRRAAFSASGMAIAFAVGRPAVVDLQRVATDPTGSVRVLPLLGGWRLGWSPDDGRLAVGLNPWGAQNFSPATGWLLVDPTDGRITGQADSGAVFSAGEWTDGPTIDISIPLDSATKLAVPADADEVPVRSRAGWVEVRGPSRGGQNPPRWIRVVPGVALATTRAGRSVAAMVPWPEAREYDPKWQLVVLRID